MQDKNGKNIQKIRLILAFLCLGFLCIHFSFTFLYTSPLKNHKNENLHYFVNGYIHPLFWQNWSLFVPAPRDNKKIEISFQETDSSFSEYYDPLTNYKSVNKWLRYSPQGKVILGFDNALWWVYNDLRKLETPWGRELEGLSLEKFKSRNSYFILKKLILGSFHQKYEGEFRSAKVKFKVEDTESRENYFIIIPIE